jgi:hypothetical protein
MRPTGLCLAAQKEFARSLCVMTLVFFRTAQRPSFLIRKAHRRSAGKKLLLQLPKDELDNMNSCLSSIGELAVFHSIARLVCGEVKGVDSGMTYEEVERSRSPGVSLVASTEVF